MAMMATPAERLPDETLLAGLGAGDAELSVAFVRRFQGLVFGVALNVLRDRNVAEDVAQQAFERAWKHAQMFDGRHEDETTEPSTGISPSWSRPTTPWRCWSERSTSRSSERERWCWS